MEHIIALAGNPNVGKSTIFNNLTGLHQHTGNWPGKTVTCARGHTRWHNEDYTFVDLPGTYSLMAHSAEEEAARDFICSGDAQATVAVCDATCLERNLNLVLQIRAVTERLIVCVNLCDEAKKKGIRIDFTRLSELLGVPVVAASAARGIGLGELMEAPAKMCVDTDNSPSGLPSPAAIPDIHHGPSDSCMACSVNSSIRPDAPDFSARLNEQHPNEQTALAYIKQAETIARQVVCTSDPDSHRRDQRLDRLFTGPLTGVPIMLLLLTCIFWITLSGANYPSALLSKVLFRIQDRLMMLFTAANAPDWLTGLLVEGMYRVLAWVVSVMLPPMAIFFPLFTLLEDFGYLPRVAFNLDPYFKKCCACGKQALTMCMGFGCNACGVVGCRIIDSPRERLMAILTNAFVPCNGRFPTLLAIISMFVVGLNLGAVGSLLSAAVMSGLILFSILMTFLVSRLLSGTILKGEPSSFTLELPPYRRPQFGKILIRSLLDRTLFVLGRAAAVAAPAGLLIWVLAHVTVGDASLLLHISGFLDPLGRLMGMDGVILVAFLLGRPANEIVLPIILMCYLSTGSLTGYESLTGLRTLLVDHGWTMITALCTMTFCLLHWPCSTTCLTIYRESGSVKWTAMAFWIPTVIGMVLCMGIAFVGRLLCLG